MSARSRPWELSLQLHTLGGAKARVCGSVVIGVCTNVYCDNLLLVLVLVLVSRIVSAGAFSATAPRPATSVQSKLAGGSDHS